MLTCPFPYMCHMSLSSKWLFLLAGLIGLISLVYGFSAVEAAQQDKAAVQDTLVAAERSLAQEKETFVQARSDNNMLARKVRGLRKKVQSAKTHKKRDMRYYRNLGRRLGRQAGIRDGASAARQATDKLQEEHFGASGWYIVQVGENRAQLPAIRDVYEVRPQAYRSFVIESGKPVYKDN